MVFAVPAISDDHSALTRDMVRLIQALTGSINPRLISVRRDLHRHPEIARKEIRTTSVVLKHLAQVGLSPVPLKGTGLICDIGKAEPGQPRFGLRADLDALPLLDATQTAWKSQVEGVAHACGHDAHTTILLGVGLVLAELDKQGKLPKPVRLIFQPAEEVQPSGAQQLIAEGVLEGVDRIVALHCDPRYDAGSVAIRAGSITSAADLVTITVKGDGGHTSRPHLTQDLVYAAGQIVVQLPAILDRRLDPRAVVNLTWGSVHSGSVHNAIPGKAVLKGTLRVGDVRSWHQAADVLAEAVPKIAAPYGVETELDHQRGVPPVENDPAVAGLMDVAARATLGDAKVLTAEQSLGGEDFAWYVREIPGALMRLGVHEPGGPVHDLHQADFDIDEAAIPVGVEVMAASAVAA
ncbi:MAG: amidohydrolase [Bifidobacteriaceae bacterium]|jgi:amidohydrolase|nr:amidohydrolase [Bifidobacteriaceae bacterium]